MQGDIIVVERQINANEKIIRLAVSILLAAVLISMVLNIPMDLCPDEKMRSDIPFWIAENGAFPTGLEEELINNIWGFSYATMPYLPAVIASVFVRVCVALGGSEKAMLIACRLICVLASLGIYILSLEIGDMLFRDKRTTWLFAAFSCLIPQFVVCSAYFNNDVPALFGVYLTLYALIKATKNQWRYRDCVLLAVSLSVIILCYYNAYAWVLISIIYSFVSCGRSCNESPKGSFILKRFLIVVSLVFLLTGWFFIRNAYLHDGDFLGRNAACTIAEMWEAKGHEVYFGKPVSEQGYSFIGFIVLRKEWWLTSLESFFAKFGYMNVSISSQIIQMYYVVVSVGLFFGLLYFLWKKKFVELIVLLFTIGIPIFLSLLYSYNYDYEPQGRYLFPALPAISFIAAIGYSCVSKMFNRAFSAVAKQRMPVLGFAVVPILFLAGTFSYIFFTTITHVLFQPW